jgi:flagellar basal body-associated protein FliL
MEEKEHALALAYIKSGINFIIIGWLPWMIMLSIFCYFLYFSNRADRQEAPR